VLVQYDRGEALADDRHRRGRAAAAVRQGRKGQTGRLHEREARPARERKDDAAMSSDAGTIADAEMDQHRQHQRAGNEIAQQDQIAGGSARH